MFSQGMLLLKNIFTALVKFIFGCKVSTLNGKFYL
jgi:hypothetical protein